MVDRARPQLDREPDRALLRELVAVKTQRETRGTTRLEIPPCLRRVERAALEEHVGGLRELGSLREHIAQREVEIRVGVVELGRDGVGAQPRRDAARRADCTQRRELRLDVEAVAGLRLEGGRAGTQHPVAVSGARFHQLVRRRRTRGSDRGHDPAAFRVELLVRCAACPQGELVDAVAGEARVRVAVDEPRDRAEPAPVELD